MANNSWREVAQMLSKEESSYATNLQRPTLAGGNQSQHCTHLCSGLISMSNRETSTNVSVSQAEVSNGDNKLIDIKANTQADLLLHIFHKAVLDIELFRQPIAWPPVLHYITKSIRSPAFTLI